jgi:hypothetical protein
VQRAPLSVPRGFPPRTGVRNRGSALTLRSGPVFLVRIRAARECGGRGTTLLRDSRPFLTPLFTEVRGIGLLGTSDARSCVEPVLCRLSYVRGGGTVLACVHKKGRAGARVTLPDPCLPAQTRPPASDHQVENVNARKPTADNVAGGSATTRRPRRGRRSPWRKRSLPGKASVRRLE